MLLFWFLGPANWIGGEEKGHVFFNCGHSIYIHIHYTVDGYCEISIFLVTHVTTYGMWNSPLTSMELQTAVSPDMDFAAARHGLPMDARCDRPCALRSEDMCMSNIAAAYLESTGSSSARKNSQWARASTKSQVGIQVRSSQIQLKTCQE